MIFNVQYVVDISVWCCRQHQKETIRQLNGHASTGVATNACVTCPSTPLPALSLTPPPSLPGPLALSNNLPQSPFPSFPPPLPDPFPTNLSLCEVRQAYRHRICTCSAVDEMIEQQSHLWLSCHLGDHPADQLIRLQQLCCHTPLAQPVYQIVGNLHNCITVIC